MVAAFTRMFISNLGNCNLEINAQQKFINIQKKLENDYMTDV